MMTETNTATSTTETTETSAQPATKKPAAKRTATRKPVARNTAARKTSAKKRASKAERKVLNFAPAKFKEAAGIAQGAFKTAVYVQLGIYGKVYDELTSRFEATRKEAPKQWSALVSRGEKVRQDFEKSGEDLKSKIGDIDFKDGVKKVKVSYRESLSKVKEFGKKAA